MKRTMFVLTTSAVILTMLLSSSAQAGPIKCFPGQDPGAKPGAIVSPAWLASHANLGKLVIVDIRTSEEYQAGHIPNAINIPIVVPESAWITTRDDLLLELPEPADLFTVLGNAGITRDSVVVVVTSFGDPPYPQANANRVAETLSWAGVKTVTVLDGGHPNWVAQGLPVTTVVPSVTPVPYTATVNAKTFVDTDYVHQRIGKSIIVDARDAAVYAGQVVEPWADKPGHIPSARSLPAVNIWKPDGTYQSSTVLKKMAADVVGANPEAEIIVYCGVGGYAGSLLYLLGDVLGYRNVKMYDGSAQEWVRYHDMEM